MKSVYRSSGRVVPTAILGGLFGLPFVALAFALPSTSIGERTWLAVVALSASLVYKSNEPARSLENTSLAPSGDQDAKESVAKSRVSRRTSVPSASIV